MDETILQMNHNLKTYLFSNKVVYLLNTTLLMLTLFSLIQGYILFVVLNSFLIIINLKFLDNRTEQKKLILSNKSIIIQSVEGNGTLIKTVLWKDITWIDYNYKLITIYYKKQSIQIKQVDFPSDYFKIKQLIKKLSIK